MPHLLIAGKLHDDGLALLHGADVTWDYEPSADPTAYLPLLPNADALLLRRQPLTAVDIDTAEHLQIVSRHGVNYDLVDVDALTARGIPLTISGNVNSEAVAEHAMALLLTVSRRVMKTALAFRAGDWGQRNDFEPQEIQGKHLLVVGYGRIGRAMARRAQAFGMRVSAHDPFLAKDHFEGVTRVETLDAVLPDVDAVSLHMSGTDGPILGAAQFASMKPSATVINTACGDAVDEPALIAALQAGSLGGAGLDVLATEPPDPDNPLLFHPNAVVTPHAAGLTHESAGRMAMMGVQNVLDHFAGRLNPDLVVNPSVL